MMRFATKPLRAAFALQRCGHCTFRFMSSETASLKVTPAAVNRLLAIGAKHKADRVENADKLALRVQLSSGGCSGFKYTLALEHSDPADDDVVIEHDGARVFVDRASLELLAGSTVDFVEELGRSAFVVANNPTAASSCGCGSSFTAKMS